jgi:hypothetical protein
MAIRASLARATGSLLGQRSSRVGDDERRRAGGASAEFTSTGGRPHEERPRTQRLQPDRRSRRAGFVAGCAFAALACGGGSEGSTLDGANVGAGTGVGGNLSLGGTSSGSSTGGAQLGGKCAVTSAGADVVKMPVDIILVIDNSGSMEDEIVGVQNNINDNFATILSTAAIDYQVILISSHGSATKNREICIEAPLSGAASCEPPPAAPAPTERFKHYDLGIDSNDSFHKLLGSFRDPAADFQDGSNSAPNGWSAWLRPQARKVFIEITDDDPEGMSWQEFDTALLASSEEQFGASSARKYVWHSIVGITEKPVPAAAWLADEALQQAMCGGSTGGKDSLVVTPGLPYQELSKLTGGLRFPICQWASYDAVFQSIAGDVISGTELACDFAIPAPPTGEALDLSKVAVSYTPGNGGPVQTYAQASTRELCEPNAFYIQDDRIYLCPDTCAAVKVDAAAMVDVLYTCERSIIDPK